MGSTRTRRSEEQLVADLEARIAALKARAARKQAKADPAVRHMTGALRSIDKALDAAQDSTVRKALQDARSTLSACLAVDGIVVASGTTRRRGQGVSPEALLEHIKKHPGQKGEQIAAALGSDTQSLRTTMKKLIAARKVKTTGQRRGMSYSPA